MKNIDQLFIDEYVYNAQHELDFPKMGGTDWRFAERIAPSFKEVLEIVKPEKVLEFGFNVGASALMFLSINSSLIYDSIDLNDAPKSRKYLSNRFVGFHLKICDTANLKNRNVDLFNNYDLVFIDANHEYDAVISDTESALKFNPKFILYDDWNHPSHSYIETIASEIYKEKLEVVKVFRFDDVYQGYSMGLCKVK